MSNVDEKANQILKSINSIEKYGYKDKIKNEILDELYNIRDRMISGKYSDLESIISEYNSIAVKIWQEYLGSSEQEDRFRYLVHNIGDREYYDDYRDNVISTSLISDKQIAFFSQWSQGTPNGFIINPKGIRTATYFDNTIDNTDFQTNGSYNWLQLPYELEQDFISDAKQNDTYLSYRAKGNKEYYGDNCNEIACDDFNIVGYFFVSFGEGKLSPIYEKSQRMAEARGIPLKEIDFMKARAKNGLEPMNEDMKRTLFANLMLRLGNQLREKNKYKYYPIVDKDFIEYNFENFAQRYIELKSSSDFSTENILKQFRQTLLDYEYKMSIENSQYDIGSGLYIDEMNNDDWAYIESLVNKDKEEAYSEPKNLTWKQVAEGSIDTYRNNPNETVDRLRKLREALLDQDKLI